MNLLARYIVSTADGKHPMRWLDYTLPAGDPGIRAIGDYARKVYGDAFSVKRTIVDADTDPEVKFWAGYAAWVKAGKPG